MLKYPNARRDSTSDMFFDTKVPDPYRWMENEGDDELKLWIEEQVKTTREYFEGNPLRQDIYKRLKELYDFPKYGPVRVVGNKIIYSYNTGLQSQNVYYIQDGIDKDPKVLIDPNALSPDGTISITLNGVCKNKRYLSYLSSQSGSDWQELRVIDLDTLETLDDKLNWVKFTMVSWHKDEFYYSRYDAPAIGKELSDKNKDMKIYCHKLGDDQKDDKLVYEDGDNPLRYHSLFVPAESNYMLISSSEGTYGNQVSIKEIDSDDDFRIIFKGFDTEHSFVTYKDGLLYFITDEDAPNKKLISFDPKDNTVIDVIKESSNPLDFVYDIGDGLVAVYQKHVTSYPLHFDYTGKMIREIATPGLGVTYEFSGSKDQEYCLFSYTSFDQPLSLYMYHKEKGKVECFKESALNFDPNQIETKQIFVTSKDGAKVPVFLTYKKGLELNGANPTLLYAYGGFNVSIPPAFRAANILLIEKGGIYAQANIRGGSEYGEEWHKQGMLLNKQNVFDDFVAVAETLISDGYTSKEKLAIQGGSNGGLLIGTVVNQRPDLFSVAYPQVGVLDMLRYHKFTIGWGWVVEYGNPEDEVHFSNLFGYSPLHNINEVEHPAIMVMTADHDDRVVPAHSYKYIAEMQHKNIGSKPTLIRIDTKAGHGAGKSTEKIIDEYADFYAFMFANLK